MKEKTADEMFLELGYEKHSSKSNERFDLYSSDDEHLSRGIRMDIENDIEELKHLNRIGNVLGTRKHIAIDNVLEYIEKLENKLMYSLSPTNHELAITTQKSFKKIIQDNIEEDTYTIKRKLKEYWNDEVNCYIKS